MFEISNTDYVMNYPSVNILKHTYYVYATGTHYLSKTFASRLEAEISMYKYCKLHNIRLELTEDDKHEKKYSNHMGIRFYINRV